MDERTARTLSVGRRLSAEVLEPLKRTFVGKDEIVDLCGVCLVAAENLFLYGPPGTAKSAIVRELGRRLGGRTFDYLLTRFTEPSELFGPFDIRKLREGELLTNTEGMLPEASLVFLDELLNANSAILNGLLGVLNERVFRRGRETRPLPLVSAFGASNRLPEDEALGALYDRFLLRVKCDPVPEERLGDVLEAGWRLEETAAAPAPTVALDDVRALGATLARVDLAAVRPSMVALVRRLRLAGIAVSDRRAVKLQRLVAASALLCGRTSAVVSDLWVFRYVWDTDEQREPLAAIVDEALKGSDDADAHPRARGTAPDPEALGAELERLAAAAGAAGSSGALAARDRLAALSARCQWVADDTARKHLQSHADALWARLGLATG